MAIEIATILQFRGVYKNFDASKLLPGQLAVVTSGDPNTTNGQALYCCFAGGAVKRIVDEDNIGLPRDDQVSMAVSSWLDIHPEATTTVEDKAITEAKLADDVLEKFDVCANEINDLYDRVGNLTVPHYPMAYITDSVLDYALNTLPNYCFTAVKLGAENYTGTDLPNSNYAYGSCLIFKRALKSIYILLFPGSMSNYRPLWKRYDSTGWSDWYSFDGCVSDGTPRKTVTKYVKSFEVTSEGGTLETIYTATERCIVSISINHLYQNVQPSFITIEQYTSDGINTGNAATNGYYLSGMLGISVSGNFLMNTGDYLILRAKAEAAGSNTFCGAIEVERI